MKILIDGQALIIPLALALTVLITQIVMNIRLIGGEKDDEDTEARRR